MNEWRGWVEVCWSAVTDEWTVYDWSEHYDSGSEVFTSKRHDDAERFALAWASKHKRKYNGATVVSLRVE